jgi:hypothetical protein
MRSDSSTSVREVRLPVAAALVIVLVSAAATAAYALSEPAAEPPPLAELPAVPTAPEIEPVRPQPEPPRPEPIRWRRSLAVGSHTTGRLVRSVRLPAERPEFFTWDPVKRRSPNRPWRRFGTHRVIRVLLDVAREYRAAHPRATRMAIGDISRPRGGDFGPQFGYIGHASHQIGLDVDVYYPRSDGRERAPKDATQIDRRLSQELVDRFLARGADVIFVGPNTRLAGPPGRVQAIANHDNHLHVRFPLRF